MLVIAQVVLALQLPFTLIPLIKATSERKLMGRYTNSLAVQLLSWGSTVVIFLASLTLFVSLFLPDNDVHPKNLNTTGTFVAPSGFHLPCELMSPQQCTAIKSHLLESFVMA